MLIETPVAAPERSALEQPERLPGDYSDKQTPATAMCRVMLFTGSCTKCGGDFTWDDLTQELPCLEAKNSGLFGECDKGVQVDEHSFDQECNACADEDEGFVDAEHDSKDDSARGKKRQRTN